jgi:hypothetical protein
MQHPLIAVDKRQPIFKKTSKIRLKILSAHGVGKYSIAKNIRINRRVDEHMSSPKGVRQVVPERNRQENRP